MKKKPPLAEQIRPKNLNEFVGQSHLLGSNKPLRLMFDAKQIHSFILWGPPGVGKTTLARMTAHYFKCEFMSLSAVFSGVKELRAAIAEAQVNIEAQKTTVLFIDEIHRFNKAQQDALLSAIESGLLILIGATTENPSFEVNNALLSRMRVYQLLSLSNHDLSILLKRILQKHFEGYNWTASAFDCLIHYADGDARQLLNLLEITLHVADKNQLQTIDDSMLDSCIAESKRRFDKQGDIFYDEISALHKSVRGSNPNAALYWLCRMLDGGVDRSYLIRRMLRMAWEDIGLAEPRAVQLCQNAAESYERLGTPEGELAIAEAIIFLAVAPKSNAAYKAFNEAMAFVKKDKSRDVPLHLRNAPTKLMKEQGYGKDYRYVHDEPYGYATNVHYFPESLSEMTWYFPVERGLEKKIKEKLEFLQRLNQTSDNQ